MDQMLLGETVDLKDQEYLYGYWMPSGGNDGIASVEVFLVDLAMKTDDFEVGVQTKKSDEDDSDATELAKTSIKDGESGVFEFKFSNARDLVRYRIKGNVKDQHSFVHLQFIDPSWAPN